MSISTAMIITHLPTAVDSIAEKVSQTHPRSRPLRHHPRPFPLELAHFQQISPGPGRPDRLKLK